MADEKSALASARGAWNPFRALFNPAIVDVAAVPKLKPVYDVLKTMADVAIAGAPAIKDAIADAGGLDPVPPLTPAEDARATQLCEQISALMQAFESETRFKVLAMMIERSADGKAEVIQPTLVR